VVKSANLARLRALKEDSELSTVDKATTQVYAAAIRCILDYWPEGFRRFLYWCEPNLERDLRKKVNTLTTFWANQLWNSYAFRFVWEAFHGFDADRFCYTVGLLYRPPAKYHLISYRLCQYERNDADFSDLARDTIRFDGKKGELLPAQIWRKNMRYLFFRREDLRDWCQAK
jgi:hypothetical protein